MTPTANLYLLANIIAQLIVTSFVFLYSYWRPFSVSLNTQLGPHDLLAWSIYKIPNSYSVMLGVICAIFCIIAGLSQSEAGLKFLKFFQTSLNTYQAKWVLCFLVACAGIMFFFMKITHVIILLFIPFFIVQINHFLFRKKPESLFAQMTLFLWWTMPIIAGFQGENRARQLYENELYLAISTEDIKDFNKNVNYKEVKLLGTLGDYFYVISPDNKDKYQIHNSQLPIMKIQTKGKLVNGK